MNIPEFLEALKEPDKHRYMIISANDFDLRMLYLNRFCQAHGGKPKFVEKIDFKNKSRVLNTKDILVLTDFKPALDKPIPDFKSYNQVVVFLYTELKTIKSEIYSFFDNNILLIPDLTKQQAVNILDKKGLDFSIIDYLSENVLSPAEIRLFGLQILELSEELSISQSECFQVYFKENLKSDVGEEPTPFLNAILNSDYNFVFYYLSLQRGNEFWVYASIFRWLENILRFVSCSGDYWNKGGLVKAVYSQFQNRGLERIPWVLWIHLYEVGLEYRDLIKQTERDALSGLEVYVCYIIQTLVENQVIKPVIANIAEGH